jgi:hypothetical protein
MPRGYRCVILAAFGWLILAAAPGKDRQPQPDNASASREAQSGFDKIATAIKEADKPPKPDAGCDPGKEDRHSDLCAQWKAADAASNSFWAGVTGLVIGGFTLLAAGFAAWYARKAWQETKRGADATELAAGETKRIGEAQTRCYLSLDSCSIRFDDEGRAYVKIEVTNHGGSPARYFSWNRELHVGFAEPAPPGHSGFNFNIGVSEGSIERMVMVGGVIISAGKQHVSAQHVGEPFLTPEVRKRINRYGFTVQIKLRLFWRDVFGNSFQQTFQRFAMFDQPDLRLTKVAIAGDMSDTEEERSEHEDWNAQPSV